MYVWRNIVTHSSNHCCIGNVTMHSYLIHRTIFGKQILNIKCVFLISVLLLSIIFLILKTIRRHITTNVHTSSCKVSLILVRLKSTLFVYYRHILEKNSQIPNFRKIRPVAAEMFVWTDRQTDMAKKGGGVAFPAILLTRLKNCWARKATTWQTSVIDSRIIWG